MQCLNDLDALLLEVGNIRKRDARFAADFEIKFATTRAAIADTLREYQNAMQYAQRRADGLAEMLQERTAERDALAAEVATLQAQLAQRTPQPSDYENSQAEERIRQIDLLYATYGNNRDKWPQHAQDSFVRHDTAQREYEAKYC